MIALDLVKYKQMFASEIGDVRKERKKVRRAAGAFCALRPPSRIMYKVHAQNCNGLCIYDLQKNIRTKTDTHSSQVLTRLDQKVSRNQHHQWPMKVLKGRGQY